MKSSGTSNERNLKLAAYVHRNRSQNGSTKWMENREKSTKQLWIFLWYRSHLQFLFPSMRFKEPVFFVVCTRKNVSKRPLQNQHPAMLREKCCMLSERSRERKRKSQRSVLGWMLREFFLCSAQQNLSQKQREEEEKKRLFLPQPTSCFASFMERFYDHHHCSTNLQRSISSCMYFYEAKERTPGEKTDRR